MADFKVEIQGLRELKLALKDYPKVSAPRFAKAINASLMQIQKMAVGDETVFQFKLPRAKRSGLLSATFGLPDARAQGLELATPNKLRGTIGPTRYYAPFVEFGTSRGIAPNPYMERILSRSKDNINKEFQGALKDITDQIAKQTNIR